MKPESMVDGFLVVVLWRLFASHARVVRQFRKTGRHVDIVQCTPCTHRTSYKSSYQTGGMLRRFLGFLKLYGYPADIRQPCCMCSLLDMNNVREGKLSNNVSEDKSAFRNGVQ
jgi:hypothetical protein